MGRQKVPRYLGQHLAQLRAKICSMQVDKQTSIVEVNNGDREGLEGASSRYLQISALVHISRSTRYHNKPNRGKCGVWEKKVNKRLKQQTTTIPCSSTPSHLLLRVPCPFDNTCDRITFTRIQRPQLLSTKSPYRNRGHPRALG